MSAELSTRLRSAGSSGRPRVPGQSSSPERPSSSSSPAGRTRSTCREWSGSTSPTRSSGCRRLGYAPGRWTCSRDRRRAASYASARLQGPRRAAAQRWSSPSPRAHSSLPFHRWWARRKLPQPRRCGGSGFASTSCASRRPGPVPEGHRRRPEPEGWRQGPEGIDGPAQHRGCCARRRLDSDRADDGGGARSERRRLARHRCDRTLAGSRLPRLVDSRVVHASSRNGADAVAGGRDHGTRGSTVRITVSGGRQVRTVPDVVGETRPLRIASCATPGSRCEWWTGLSPIPGSRGSSSSRIRGRNTRAGHDSGDDLRRPPGLT